MLPVVESVDWSLFKIAEYEVLAVRFYFRFCQSMWFFNGLLHYLVFFSLFKHSLAPRTETICPVSEWCRWSRLWLNLGSVPLPRCVTRAAETWRFCREQLLKLSYLSGRTLPGIPVPFVTAVVYPVGHKTARFRLLEEEVGNTLTKPPWSRWKSNVALRWRHIITLRGHTVPQISSWTHPNWSSCPQHLKI